MPRPGSLLSPALLALALAACAPARPAAGLVREGTPDAVNIARARQRDQQPLFSWETWGPEAFERARREHKFILLDGAAEWCHWCHVMDETTYLDPEVGRALRERFVTIRVDIDSRPDIADRYGEWGWPATILFSPEAEEIGKYRGYLPPEQLRDILGAVATAARAEAARPSGPADLPAPAEALAWIAGLASARIDDYYDPDQGGWGRRQKTPIGANIEFELRRAAHGDQAALARALFTLRQQRALIDPVWGGIYQYSAGRDWTSPHYEKLMDYQASNLEALARGHAASQDPSLLADARRIASYLDSFLSAPDGAFLVSQDADVNAHDHRAPFVDGDVYYRLPEARRRELGVPRVDDHVYGHENGVAIAALCALHETSRDPAPLARARRAADLARRTLVAPDGAVRRGATGPRHLADAADLGRGLARLAELTGEPAYREAALRVAAAMQRDLGSPDSGAFWGHTPDPAAAGVFARRDRPFTANLAAARFLAALARATGDQAHRDRGQQVLRSLLTPAALESRGRLLGDLLLALDELVLYPWMPTKSVHEQR
jgi:hypothetical protein